ncbi:hypothetical protein AURANDRAFT_63429 [Aureococcus anophagefferens]|uniref:Uncharacterized protein n=1 Tax=Aureococcus anophagefferens TaxID=44056 RepID=F0Y6X3_AURAN|nr:hypothetical protein AURANDRAFT_63429 [Aureococcus anophagefferens]EGB09292.1 hypothetical protein AURANDRAFT_63429 [Aureococcus anophagefferens]|eukprot:XP_009036392.1 hypothetical protein AURANDRAFT_63429 [Aureococcus anophagefferens]
MVAYHSRTKRNGSSQHTTRAPPRAAALAAWGDAAPAADAFPPAGPGEFPPGALGARAGWLLRGVLAASVRSCGAALRAALRRWAAAAAASPAGAARAERLARALRALAEDAAVVARAADVPRGDAMRDDAALLLRRLDTLRAMSLEVGTRAAAAAAGGAAPAAPRAPPSPPRSPPRGLLAADDDADDDDGESFEEAAVAVVRAPPRRAPRPKAQAWLAKRRTYGGDYDDLPEQPPPRPAPAKKPPPKKRAPKRPPEPLLYDVASCARRLAEALYKVGERLFACVDADFREMPLRVRRPPVHLDVQRLEVFQNKLHAGREKSANFPTSKAPLSAVFHSFRLIFGRAIISRNGLEACMLFPERARAEHPR